MEDRIGSVGARPHMQPCASDSFDADPFPLPKLPIPKGREHRNWNSGSKADLDIAPAW